MHSTDCVRPLFPVCGPPRYAEMRINISQAFNGIGTVIAPVLGSYVFFTFDDETALNNVKWVYLAIAIFVFILAFAFFCSTIPEITDADMASVGPPPLSLTSPPPAALNTNAPVTDSKRARRTPTPTTSPSANSTAFSTPRPRSSVTRAPRLPLPGKSEPQPLLSTP